MGGLGPARGGRGGAVLEAPGLVTGLDDVAVVREAVQQGRGHLGVAEDAAPLAEAQVGGDDNAGVLVKLGQQVEQQGTTRATEAALVLTATVNRHYASLSYTASSQSTMTSPPYEGENRSSLNSLCRSLSRTTARYFC